MFFLSPPFTLPFTPDSPTPSNRHLTGPLAFPFYTSTSLSYILGSSRYNTSKKPESIIYRTAGIKASALQRSLASSNATKNVGSNLSSTFIMTDLAPLAVGSLQVYSFCYHPDSVHHLVFGIDKKE